jgi:hypothetical protein
MGRQRPASVSNAILVQAVLVLVSGLTTLITLVQRDELVASWASRQPPGAQPPAFGPVAVVLFLTFALLVGVLVVFFRGGHPSARWSLTGLAFFYLFVLVVVLRLDPPGLFVALVGVSAVLDLVLLYFLWHKDTSAFLRGAELAAGRDA